MSKGSPVLTACLLMTVSFDVAQAGSNNSDFEINAAIGGRYFF